MTSEALQNPYFVRLYCKNIDKAHSLTEPNDKIKFHGNYFFQKGGGTTLEKGGGTDPLFPPPPLNPPLLNMYPVMLRLVQRLFYEHVKVNYKWLR